MISSVYGKTMESLRKRTNVRLVNNEKDFLKYMSRPGQKNYVAIHEIKPVLMLNKQFILSLLALN